MRLGSMSERSIAALAAAAPSSIAETSLKAPPKAPKGVRAPSTTNTSLLMLVSPFSGRQPRSGTFVARGRADRERCPAGRTGLPGRGLRPALESRCHHVSDPSRAEAAPRVEGWNPPGENQIADRSVDGPCRITLADVVEQHAQRGDGANGTGDSLPGNIRSGAVNRLEHRHQARVDVSGRRAAETALDRGPQIRDDVPEEIGRDDDVESPGIFHHVHHRSVHVHRVGCHIRVFQCDLGKDAPPYLLRPDSIRLIDESDMPAPVGARGQVESIADRPLDAAPGEYHVGQGDLVRGAGPHDPAAAGVDVLRVLAHHHHVDVGGADALERGDLLGEQYDRAQVDVQVELQANGENDRTLDQAALNPWVADRAQIDGVQRPHLVDRRRGHELARLEVVPSTPGVLDELALETEYRFRPVEHLQTLADHFWPDAVAGDYPDAVRPVKRLGHVAAGASCRPAITSSA